MNNNNIKYTLHVKLKKDDIFFGNGICTLLDLVHELKSLKLACEHMSMAYSKGYKILKKAEHELGFPLLERKIGGVHGGGSTLTEKGFEFLQTYKIFRAEVFKSTDEIFVKYYPDQIL